MFLVNGGWSISGSGFTDSTEIFDPDVGSWRFGTALPSPMWDLKAASIENRILFFGRY